MAHPFQVPTLRVRRSPTNAPLLAVALLSTVTLSACGLTPRNIWVYIDNAGSDVLEIHVDGQLAATVAPDEYSRLILPPGEHRFVVAAGSEQRYDFTKKLVPSDRLGVTRTYLFNPDQLVRYQIYAATSGKNRSQALTEASLLTSQNDPQLKRQFTYRQLLDEIKLVPAGAWHDVTGIDDILASPPDEVTSQAATLRTALSRVPPRLAESLERLSTIENPTDDDIEALNDLLDNIFANAL